MNPRNEYIKTLKSKKKALESEMIKRLHEFEVEFEVLTVVTHDQAGIHIRVLLDDAV